MKAPLLSTMIASFGMLSAVCQAQTESPAAPKTQEQTAPAKPAKLNLVRYKGKTGKPSTNVKVSTRSGEQSAIRIVAIAPGDEGITHKTQPRFWWYQNEPTKAGELEFVLTRLGKDAPSVMLRRPVPPMKAGFNVIDLSNRNVNPEAVTMEGGTAYQWTINVRSGVTLSPVYSRVTLHETTTPRAPTDPIEVQLAALGEQGNWYELFDLTCSGAEIEVSGGSMNNLRTELLTSIRLIGEIK